MDSTTVTSTTSATDTTQSPTIMTETMDIDSSIQEQNGSNPGTSGMTVNTENGHNNSELAEGEVSPSSLRRSTRVSALKAQEKLKFKEGMGFFTETNGTENNCENTVEEPVDEKIDEPKKKKSCLITGKDLDQYDCKFGIRMEKDDVYMLTDESEISSLNEEEVNELRKNYEEFLKAGITSEQQFERDIQVKQLEAQLRLEENKLVMLKKTLQNQKEAELEAIKKQRLLAEATQRQQMAYGAYKAPVATNPSSKVNGTAQKQSNKGTKPATNLTKDAQQFILNMDPPTQKAFLQKLSQNPQLAQQFSKILDPQFLQVLQQQQSQNMQKSASANNLGSIPTANSTTSTIKKESTIPTTTPTQRANEARKRLRQHLDQQLLSIPPPKSIINEINFIPSATNEFCYLLGLDLTVQRVLKDKNVFKKYDEKPYVCEECGTDFTPSWKAIGQNENDLHLYCEACVRQAQKKKMKQDHATVFKKAFVKIAEQEKELEKQIAAGKFDDPPAPPPQPKPTPPPASTSTVKQSSSSGNLAPNMVAALQLLQQQHNKKMQQQPSTSAQSSKSNQNIQPQQQKAGQKRQATSSTTTSSNAGNTSTANLTNQQQLFMNMLKANQAFMAMKNVQNNPQAWMNILQLMSGGNNQVNNMGGQMALLQAMLQSQQGQSNNAAMQQLAMMSNPFLQQIFALQANNMKNLNSNKSRK